MSSDSNAAFDALVPRRRWTDYALPALVMLFAVNGAWAMVNCPALTGACCR